MKRDLRVLVSAGLLLLAVSTAAPASAQKPGGILKMYSPDSPASMSIHEEATFVAEGPMMGVFNNLVIFDQHVKQNSLDSIVSDLATAWSWNEDGTELTLSLRQGVKWHETYSPDYPQREFPECHRIFVLKPCRFPSARSATNSQSRQQRI